MTLGRGSRCGVSAVLAVVVPLLMAPGPALGNPAPAASAASAPGPGCGQALDARHRRVITSARHQLVFAPQPAPMVSGRHFALDIVVCARGSASLPLALRVDADMPAHRHGMNYRPTVRALGDSPGRYRADGLLLHMAGRWRFMFEISADGRLERLHQELDVE